MDDRSSRSQDSFRKIRSLSTFSVQEGEVARPPLVGGLKLVPKKTMHFQEQQVMEAALDGITKRLGKKCSTLKIQERLMMYPCISSILARRSLVGSCQIVRHDCLFLMELNQALQ